MKLQWSKYQQAIFEDVKSGVGHTLIIARAGSSKTTSIVESFKHLPRGKKALVVAFNKSIAQELQDRAGDKQYLTIATLHSVGFRALKETFGNVVLDDKKCQSIVKQFIGSDDYDLNNSLCQCINLCKCMLIDNAEGVIKIIDDFAIEIGEMKEKEFVDIVLKSLEKSKEQKMIIDFSDMIYHCAALKVKLKTYDYVIIDEAQDLNKAQMSMVFGSCKKDGRIIALLDPLQAIYQFAGADTSAPLVLKNKLNAKELSLPISYRCPRKIVYMAQKFAPDFQAAPNAKDGVIHNVQESNFLDLVKPGDFVLSRTNAPLIKYCLMLLRRKIPANIAGRDLGKTLSWFVKKSKKKTIKSLVAYIEKWRDTEVNRVKALNRDTSQYEDKAECLLELCEGSDTVEELLQNINNLFNDVDDSKKVIFSSTHKAKGLERERVFLLRWTYRHGTETKGPESNIFYVAITRAKSELFIVNKESKYTKYDNNNEAKTLDKEIKSIYDQFDYNIYDS